MCIILTRTDTHSLKMAAPLSNKIFAITGAASGMGLATAKPLRSHSASLGLADINSKGLQQFQDSLEPGAKNQGSDVANQYL